MTPNERLIERAREVVAAIREGRQPRGGAHDRDSVPVPREFLPAYLNGAASVLLEQLADALEAQA